jgi:hypothetical protein
LSDKKLATSGPPYSLSVKQIVDHLLKVKPFGIEMYEVPKIERAYLLKPQYGKQDKLARKIFTQVEAELHKDVPGPIYNTLIDWNNQIPHGKGRFMKAERTIPEKFANKKEKMTPSPSQYHPLESWKQF